MMQMIILLRMVFHAWPLLRSPGTEVLQASMHRARKGGHDKRGLFTETGYLLVWGGPGAERAFS